jgi:hypothetical protein
VAVHTAVPCNSCSQSPASHQGVPGLLPGPFRKYDVQSDTGTGLSPNISIFSGSIILPTPTFSGRVSQNCEKLILTWSCLPVRPRGTQHLAPTGRIFMENDV